MFVEEVIIDGFKSYATRTVVSGFDRRFNAITGLNGSGKSNILDAICFVLGITNLSAVRANNLQELVYKQGQAGVTKASVTILFNNEDAASSPVGYEQYKQISVARQVVIGGKNKYLINGHTAQVSQVQNLFHSVQLNVNNPHFLIMQGRITKVLNMKPPEILGMIEEAAGTRMYENKKQAAIKTMNKKEKKVDEINKILAEEITPTLEKLRKEKMNYMQWAANNTEVERLTRFCIAFEYTKALQTSSKSTSELAELQAELAAANKKKVEHKTRIESIEEEMDEIQAKRDEQMQGAFTELKSKEEALGREVVKIRTKATNHQSTVGQAQTQVQSLRDQVTDLEANITQLEATIAAKTQEGQTIEKTHSECATAVSDLGGEIQALNAGVSSESSKQSLTDQLATKKRDLQATTTQIQQLQLKLKHNQSVLASKQATLAKTKSQNSAIEANENHLLNEVHKLEGRIAHVEERFDPRREAELQNIRSDLHRTVSQLRRELDDATAGMSSRLNFEYNNRNIDPRSVKGMVAKLLTLKDDWSATALEIAAGGKLYQIVVDNERTAKQLLQHGQLRNRVTIIPLNKISRKTLPRDKVRTAKDVAHENGGEAWAALDLIDYERDVEGAMEYTFGQALVCDSSNVAKAVTFHRNVMAKSVTLEGDSFDPAGTLQGGSAPSNGASILKRLHAVVEISRRLSSAERDLEAAERDLRDMREDAREYNDIQRSLDLKKHELHLLRSQIQETSYAQLQQEISHLQDEQTEATAALETAESSITKLESDIANLQSDIASMATSREGRLKSLEKRHKEAKAKLVTAVAAMKKYTQTLAELNLELKTLQQEKTTLQSTLQSAETTLTKDQDEGRKCNKQLEKLEAEMAAVTNELQLQRTALSQCDVELKALQKNLESCQKIVAECELEAKKIDHRMSRMAKDTSQATSLVENLQKAHPWIATEKEFFGRDQSDYDFKRMDFGKAQKNLAALKEAQGSLAKKINKKVMGMIEKAEQEYQSLMNKRTIIEKDKAKITSVIHELDTKKNEALEITWQKVTTDFGSIFSTLLPGTTAKLEPPENGTILDGLRVRVAFGGVWKESLTELSGGQRSLLALSLILSLLLFKPAPMYILDEVDAALDLSHTQNIGQMIRSHFSHSQFIVVSLKEGMFNNANVVFQTKFVDGVSTVSRSTPYTR
ncbi:structural maintenance of chromosomes protein [Thraustotheca clavata]|uniref:Structural maintenance of chromosomes protein n=1 Tax=Thraustotheca clavata TaxID=74557 RepID=A0A1W0AC36_9STRA|nr:structural maintenance of chromosomes protein [Thraustotheca clavata]